MPEINARGYCRYATRRPSAIRPTISKARFLDLADVLIESGWVPMAAKTQEPLSLKLLAVLGIATALYFAKAIFLPLAMAVLLTFVLAPPVRTLRAWGLPQILS